MAIPVCDLEAFCETCPPDAEVTAILQELGFHLEFQMGAISAASAYCVPALPPQYHYSDEYATEVVYLAGRDIPMEGERYPVHASRFWLWPGANAEAFQRTASLLAGKYHLCWLCASPEEVIHQESA
jgi:hypothetical protein